MRVTQTMMANDLLRNLNSSLTRMDRLQMQLSSGQRINKPSDDPSGLVKALRMRSSLAEGTQYSTNVDEARNYMNATDQALGDINEVLQKVRELTVKAATATNETDSWASISQEINQLNEQMQLLSNSQYGSKFLFAGSNVTQMPWNKATEEWSGNDQLLSTEIAGGITTPINLQMRQYFMGNLNKLLLEKVRSGIRDIKAKNLQEGQYKIATQTTLNGSEVSTARSGRGAEAAYYLHQAGGNPASLSSGQAAGLPNSEYQGELNVNITALDPATDTATVSITGRMAINGQEYQNVDFQGIQVDMAALANGAMFSIPATAAGNNNSVDDYIAGATQDLVLWNGSPAALAGVTGSMGAGQGFQVQLAVNAAGVSSAAELPSELVQIKDKGSFFWNNDLTTARVSSGTEAQLQDSPYSGSLQLRVTGVNTPAANQLTVDVTGRIALPGGEYKEIQINGKVMQMDAVNGSAIMTLTVAELQNYIPEATEELVLWNSSGLDLQGIKTTPQFSVGDSTVLELGGTESTAEETQQYLSSVSNYGTFFYEDRDQEARLGVGSSTNQNDSTFNGSLLIEATRVDVENNKVIADVKGHVYLDDGSYQYVELNNVELNMNAAAGQAIMTIPATKLPGAKQDLVLWNNSLFGSNLGGLNLIPEDNSVPDNEKTCQVTAGDRCVIALGARQYNAAAAEQYSQTLGSTDNNGMFFYMNGSNPATLASGTQAGGSASPYSGNLLMTVNPLGVDAVNNELDVTVTGQIIMPNGVVHAIVAPPTVTMHMDAASGAAVMTLPWAQLNAATGTAAFTEDLVIWNNSTASLGAINDLNPEFQPGDSVGIDIFASVNSSARVENSTPALNSLSNNGMFLFDNSMIPQAAGLVAGDRAMVRNSSYNGDLNVTVTGVNAGADTLTVNVTGRLALPGGEYQDVNFAGLIMNMAADHTLGQAVLTIPATDIDDFIPGTTENLVFWSPSVLGGIDDNNPEFAIGDQVGLYMSSTDTASVNFEYKNTDGEIVDGGTHSFSFQEHTMDRTTTNLRFFTLYERTGLEFDGSMSLVVEDFKGEEEAASFEYQAGMFQFLTDLARKVEAGKLPDTGNELEGCDVRMNELLENRATLGARINRMEAQKTHLTDLKESYTEMLAKIEDADIAEVIMQLQLQENVYRAALSTGAQIIQPTLMDFLG